MINPSQSSSFTMMAKFKIYRSKKEFKTEIPTIPQVGEIVTLHEPNPITYKVKSIEHEIKGGFYNASIILSSTKKTKS